LVASDEVDRRFEFTARGSAGDHVLVTAVEHLGGRHHDARGLAVDRAAGQGDPEGLDHLREAADGVEVEQVAVVAEGGDDEDVGRLLDARRPLDHGAVAPGAGGRRDGGAGKQPHEGGDAQPGAPPLPCLGAQPHQDRHRRPVHEPQSDEA
jgi:hypothetical protein